TPAPVPDVCGETCDTRCDDRGEPVPLDGDCQGLVDAIHVLEEHITPTFVVEAHHVQTISYKSCRFFFENLGDEPVSYCWGSLAESASTAASECLGDNSEGYCTSSDGLWEVG
ncbi:hypothetical protein C8Q80DRAFT_1063722, partial [Daedaleopsis nitida]